MVEQPIKDRGIKGWVILTFLLPLLSAIIFKNMGGLTSSTKDKMYIFNLFGIPKHTSLDPLQGDRVNNAFVQRMLYHTPIEVNVKNELTSHVLSHFSYDKMNRRVSWKIKEDIYFSDNTPITIDDVAFSVARMAFSHSRFPVIEDIVGLKDWALGKTPLGSYPSGIVVGDDTVSITFNVDHPNPLFRFAIELFSIIPKKFVNIENNKIVGPPPSSGYYIVVNSHLNDLEFRKVKSPFESHDIEAPDRIIFHYPKAEELQELSQKDDNSVLFGFDFSLLNMNIDLKKLGFQISRSQRSMYLGILLNPKVRPFDNINCRRLFANSLRKTAKKLYGDAQSINSSIFPKIVPGYLSEKALNESIGKIDIHSAKDCFRSSSRLAWHSLGEPYFDKLIQETAESVSLKLRAPKKVETRDNFELAFDLGETPFFRGGSGFWALDPLGDTKMMFTEGLHPGLNFITKDKVVRKLLGELNEDSDSNNNKLIMESLNKYIYNKSILNVFINFGYFYGTTNNVKLNPPYAVQTPYPWQVLALLIQENK